MSERFVSAVLRPDPGTVDTVRMSTGEPGLPRQFRWGQQTLEIARVLKTWRETGPCHHGSGERYVRKHWFAVRTTTGEEMQIYCDRQPRRGRNPKARWWLFTIRAQG